MADVRVIGSSKCDDSFCSSSTLLALKHGPAVSAAIRFSLTRCAADLGANVSYDGARIDGDCCFFFIGVVISSEVAPRVGLLLLLLFFVPPRLLLRLDILGGGARDDGLTELIPNIVLRTYDPTKIMHRIVLCPMPLLFAT